MSLFRELDREAQILGCSQRTIENWIGAGHITGFRAPDGKILVNHEEIEAAFNAGKMRDPRKRYGSKARIVPLPIVATVVTKGDDK